MEEEAEKRWRGGEEEAEKHTDKKSVVKDNGSRFLKHKQVGVGLL